MSDKSWEEYRIYLLETIKGMCETLKEQDRRMRIIEMRMYMVMGGVGLLLFMLELYFNLRK